MVKVRAKLGCIIAQPLTLEAIDEQNNLMSRLDELLGLEESHWWLKSRVLWVWKGDHNIKFFHRRASDRRTKNKIKGLTNEAGVWVSDDIGIESMVLGYFKNLCDQILNTIEPHVIGH